MPYVFFGICEYFDIIRDTERGQMMKKNSLKYVTGISAFNIPCYGIQCDWHMTDMVKTKRFHIHPYNYIGAEEFFGNYGIYDNTAFFLEHGFSNVDKVFVANPIRALIDILYYNIVYKNIYPYFLTLESYLFEDINKEEISKKLDEFELKIKNNKKQLKSLRKWRRENGV